MTDRPSFRTSEQEVIKLVEECAELRGALRAISSQLARIENRVKRAFPKEADIVNNRRRPLAERFRDAERVNLSPAEALAAFDQAISLVKSERGREVDSFLQSKSPEELMAIAREVGLSFKSSRPSSRMVIDALKGRLRESLMLSKHTTIHTPAAGVKSQ